MALKPVCLPDLGEGVTEGEIIKIKAAPGDVISLDQPLMEVMTDKASMEIPSADEGIVEEIKVKEGDMIPVGAVMLTLRDPVRDPGEKPAPAEQASAAQEAKNKSAPALESAKSAESEPKAKAPAKTGAEPAAAAPSASAPAAPQPQNSPPLSLPSTRRLAEEFGVPLKSVTPSGPKGEIKREDLIRHIKSMSKAAMPSAPLPFGAEEELKREPLTGIRRLMFESMSLSHATIPSFSIIEAARMDRLTDIRSGMKRRLASQNIKITYLPFFMKAAVSAMRRFPIFNSCLDPVSREAVYRKSCHVGFAADTPKGLLAPVIKNAENKSLLEIAKELQSLGELARSGRIQRDDLKGASMTLTNIGSIGGLSGAPVINPPEPAILGIYRIYRQPLKTAGGEWGERAFVNISITCDHRLIDGASAARFLKHVVSLIEEPGMLLLE